MRQAGNLPQVLSDGAADRLWNGAAAVVPSLSPALCVMPWAGRATLPLPMLEGRAYKVVGVLLPLLIPPPTQGLNRGIYMGKR